VRTPPPTILAAVWLCLAAAGSVLIHPADAMAQTSVQIPLQFDFLNPGAKSLALGGAFAGLADDATATFANPAGLTQLDGTQFSIDGRYSHTDTKFLERGRLSGAVTNRGIDTIAGPSFSDSNTSHFGPGFMAFVYMPKRSLSGGNQSLWALAGYRHELVRIDQSFLAQGVFQKDPSELTSRRDTAQQGHRAVDITAYGVSGAYFRPRLGISIGASLTFYSFHLDSDFRRYAFQGDFFGPADLNAEVGRSTQAGDSWSVAPTVGVQWLHKDTRLGLVYRHGGSFDFTTVAAPDDPPKASTFRVPNTLAFGAAWLTRQKVDPASGLSPSWLLTITGELTYITYSRIMQDFINDQTEPTGYQDNFSVDDGVEVHGGVQLTKPNWRFRPRLRAGAWFDPDHSVHYTPAPADSPFPVDHLFDERMSASLSTGENQVHYTGGVGLSFGPHFELNAGFDAGGTTRLFSTSIIVR
jgi:long-subunit fatty acid transport protein